MERPLVRLDTCSPKAVRSSAGQMFSHDRLRGLFGVSATGCAARPCGLFRSGADPEIEVLAGTKGPARRNGRVSSTPDMLRPGVFAVFRGSAYPVVEL